MLLSERRIGGSWRPQQQSEFVSHLSLGDTSPFPLPLDLARSRILLYQGGQPLFSEKRATLYLAWLSMLALLQGVNGDVGASEMEHLNG